jgi:hypothetical protein
MIPIDVESLAHAIFLQGPETVISSARTIVAGAPTRLVKRVDKQSEGSTPIPVEWTISGVLVNPRLLKGPSAPASVTFQKREQAAFMIMDSSTPQWELDLGSAEQAASAVLFYQADLQQPSKVLPSPRGGVDFVGMVSDIVRIQSIADTPGRIAAWTDYARSAASINGRMAALRSLVASQAPWPMLATTWDQLLADSRAPAEVRAFAFKLMLFEVSKGRWSDNQRAILELAQKVFIAETNSRLALDYTDGLLLLYHAARQNPAGSPGTVETICQTLQGRQTLDPGNDEQGRAVNDAYRQQRDSCLAARPLPRS